MIAAPGPIPVTTTVALVEFPGKLTVDGTVATFVSLELRFTVSPAGGAGSESVSVRVPVPVPVIVKLLDENASVNVTWTD